MPATTRWTSSLGSSTPKAGTSGAIALLAAAEVLRERLHTPLWPLALERQERLLAELREIVGDAAFEAAYTQGATVDADDVQEIVLRLGS
jgi:hypothetical protein